MDEKKKESKPLQWHSAFYAGLQIELEKEADQLLFENEHQLGTKPMEIDVLIIKKDNKRSIQKNIGRIFRKYNIIEYKSPDDYLSVDDFYKVYGYCCFYKADAVNVNTIKIEELTISFICSKYPRNLMKHLRKSRDFLVKCMEKGIYQVEGDYIPIQIIVTTQLTKEENLWLKSLTDEIKETTLVETLLELYKENRKNPLYESVMDIVVRANKEKFEEVKDMCRALEELMADKIEEKVKEGIEERIKLVEEKVKLEEEKLKEQSEKIGKEIGTKRVNDLILTLSKLGRLEDVLKAAEDREYQMQLFHEFCL